MKDLHETAVAILRTLGASPDDENAIAALLDEAHRRGTEIVHVALHEVEGLDHADLDEALARASEPR